MNRLLHHVEALAAAAIALAAVLVAWPAGAQAIGSIAYLCYPAEQWEAMLAAQYDEHPVFIGDAKTFGVVDASPGISVIVTMSKDGKTWSIYSRKGTGICTMSSGTDGNLRRESE